LLTPGPNATSLAIYHIHVERPAEQDWSVAGVTIDTGSVTAAAASVVVSRSLSSTSLPIEFAVRHTILSRYLLCKLLSNISFDDSGTTLFLSDLVSLQRAEVVMVILPDPANAAKTLTLEKFGRVQDLMEVA
jgi:hypothetical protein